MHLGTCRRDGDEEWGFKVSPKPQMMLLPRPSPADPGILPAPFTWKGVPAAAWARASPAPINLSLQISPFVCLSIRPSASPWVHPCLQGWCKQVPPGNNPGDVLSGAAQLTHPPGPATRLGAKSRLQALGSVWLSPHHSSLILPVRASLSFPQITSRTPLSRADFGSQCCIVPAAREPQ